MSARWQQLASIVMVVDPCAGGRLRRQNRKPFRSFSERIESGFELGEIHRRMLLQSFGKSLQSTFDDLFRGVKLPLGHLLLQEFFAMRGQSDIHSYPLYHL